VEYLLTEEEYVALKNRGADGDIVLAESARKLIVRLAVDGRFKPLRHRDQDEDWAEFQGCVHDLAQKPDYENEELYCDNCPLADSRLRKELGIKYDVWKSLCRLPQELSK
jgi:hypothetical protein